MSALVKLGQSGFLGNSVNITKKVVDPDFFPYICYTNQIKTITRLE